MSRVFYDHLVQLSEVENLLKKSGLNHEERVEIWHIIDEMVHHRVIGCILDKLPREHHDEFLNKFSEKPHDENLIEYLKEKIGGDLEDFIKKEVKLLSNELHTEITKKLS
jgi:hypothetical protein